MTITFDLIQVTVEIENGRISSYSGFFADGDKDGRQFEFLFVPPADTKGAWFQLSVRLRQVPPFPRW